MRRLPRLGLLVGVLALVTGGAARANLLTNGSFETPVVGPSAPFGAYEHRNGSELSAWTLFSSYKGIVQFNSHYAVGASEGEQAIQLEQPGDWVSQTFASVIGQAYQLTFDLSTYATPSTMSVAVGSTSQLFGAPSDVWVPQSIHFVADSTQTVVKFESAVGFGNQFPQLDNVSVTAVPEPTPLALMVAGLGIVGLLSCRHGPRHTTHLS
jgi:hypothetical protein